MEEDTFTYDNDNRLTIGPIQTQCSEVSYDADEIVQFWIDPHGTTIRLRSLIGNSLAFP